MKQSKLIILASVSMVLFVLGFFPDKLPSFFSESANNTATVLDSITLPVNTISEILPDDTENILIEDTASVTLAALMTATQAASISKLYPTVTNGRVWVANWSNSLYRKVESGDRDRYDSDFIVRGDGAVVIDGSGIATVTGSAPRMYVYDKAKSKKWKNVEVTIYMKRISETGTTSSQGIVIGARSEHQDATEAKPCYGRTYYGRLLYDGRAVFQKEVIHEGAYSTNKPSESNKAKWTTSNGTMPKNSWIGVKFIVRTNLDGKSVHLELYRDLTNGKNGGTWEKVADYTDTGSWAQTDTGVNVKKLCGYEAGSVLTNAGTSVFVRNDAIKKVQYKLFSVREIQ